MSHKLSRLFARLSNRYAERKNGAAVRRRRALAVEPLEDRTLMSVSPWTLDVNTPDSHLQGEAAVASMPNGTSRVAVWSERAAGSSNSDIKGQFYNGYGEAVGGEFFVAASSRNEFAPDVAMDLYGNITVVWVEENTWGSQDIRGARFSTAGRRLNTFTVANTSLQEYDPSIATGFWGSMFVVSYTRDASSTNSDVRAGIFFGSGQRYKDLSVWSSYAMENNSSVAANASGEFFVAYERHYSSGNDNVSVTHFSATGVRDWSRTLDSSTRSDLHPDVAVDGSGEGVVVFQASNGWGSEIRAREFNRAGLVGSERLIQNSVPIGYRALPSHASNPVVATRDMDEGYAVAYEYEINAYPYESVVVREVSGSGAVQPQQSIGMNLDAPAIAMMSDGHYIVAANNNDVVARTGFFNLSTESDKVLYLNFEGASLTRNHLNAISGDWNALTQPWGVNLVHIDPDSNGISVSRYLADRSNRQQVIDRVLELVRADLAPFGVEVRLHTGGPVTDQQATTVFIGANNDLAGLGGVAGDIDVGNDNRTDVAFADEERWFWTGNGFAKQTTNTVPGAATNNVPTGSSFSVEGTALAMADTIIHEAGHTFGLSHVSTGSALETMGLRYSQSWRWNNNGRQWYQDGSRWVQDTSYMDRSFYETSGGGALQNSRQELLDVFGSGKVYYLNQSYSPYWFSAANVGSQSADAESMQRMAFATQITEADGKRETADEIFAGLGKRSRESRVQFPFAVGADHADDLAASSMAQMHATRRIRFADSAATFVRSARNTGAVAEALWDSNLLLDWAGV